MNPHTHTEEFLYRLPASTAGSRPGAHHGLSRGSGMRFAAHARLFDVPDPRRLDLRASLSDVRGDWLIRTFLQPASITVHVLLDVSASMRFGQPGKLQVAADFLHSLGISAHGYGDAISLLAFDSQFRDDLYQPPQRGRGVGTSMAETVRSVSRAAHAAAPLSLWNRAFGKTLGAVQSADSQNNTCTALQQAVSRLEGQTGLVFLLSDFHWKLDELEPLLDKLANATLVPMVIWDKAEVVPPDAGQLLFAREIESARKRQLWISEPKRRQWLENVEKQREQLIRVFARHHCTPVFIESEFNAQQLTRHFTEHLS